jgi:hypothetical protein
MGLLHRVGWDSQRYNAHPFSDGGGVEMHPGHTHPTFSSRDL